MCSTIKSGTKAYMDLYPEGSTDGVSFNDTLFIPLLHSLVYTYHINVIPILTTS